MVPACYDGETFKETFISKRDITHRFETRADAERYRDRFERGKRRRTHEREVGALRQVLRRCGPAQDTILDVGSGTGRFAPVFGEHARHVVQLDLARHMLDVNRAGPAARSNRLSYVQADVFRLPIAARSVDLVFCHRLLNHLPLPEQRLRALENLVRVTRRWVVVSSLGPPRVLQHVREIYDLLRGVNHTGASRYVAPHDLMTGLAALGLRLADRITIRAFPLSAEFLVFES